LLGPTDLKVLVTGESGTGKELASRELHRFSQASGPFIAVNCAALPEPLVEAELFGHARGAFTGAVSDKPGLFEMASGGTLFLDEVSELPLVSQAKLLRAVETQKIRRVGSAREIETRCRIISATNRDLDAMVDAGTFRGDLAARLAEATLDIPPLRNRREDLPLLIDHLSPRALTFDARSFERMICYDWPLNVRELSNTVRMLAATVDAGEVAFDHLPPSLQRFQSQTSTPSVAATRPVDERVQSVLDALAMHNGNVRRTSQYLGISRSSIYRCLDISGVDPKSLRSKSQGGGTRRA
jgi:two-component system response regulator HydG